MLKKIDPTAKVSVKKQINKFSLPGKFEIASGSLSKFGFSNKIIVPATTKPIATIIFTGDWLFSGQQYQKLLCHLASHGFVVVESVNKPNLLMNEKKIISKILEIIKLLPLLSFEALDLKIDSHRLVLLGHGFGASCNILAAAKHIQTQTISLKSTELPIIVSLFPTPLIGEVAAASSIASPGMILAESKNLNSLTSNALDLHKNWKGISYLRIGKLSSRGLPESSSIRKLFSWGKPNTKTQTAVKVTTLAFLINYFNNSSNFIYDPKLSVAKTKLFSGHVANSVAENQKINQLINYFKFKH